MFSYLVVLFTVLPALELMVLFKVGAIVGPMTTFMIIILTGVWGAYLARLQGFVILQKIQNDLNKGVIPNNEMMEGLMILVGGILLLTPGFITDTFGLLLLIPLTRAIIRLFVQNRFQAAIKKGNVNVYTQGKGPQQENPFGSKRQFKPKNDGYEDIDIN